MPDTDIAALVARLNKSKAIPADEGDGRINLRVMTLSMLVGEAAAALQEMGAERECLILDYQKEYARAERAEAEREDYRRAWNRADEQVAALRADAERFVWWFSDTVKSGEYINEYLRGVREHWTLDQWRASIDAVRAQEQKT